MATSRKKISLHARLSTLQMHEASAWIRFTCLSCFPDKTLGVLQNSPQPIKISIDTGRQRQRGLGAPSPRLRVFSHVAVNRLRFRGRDWHGDEKVAGDKIVEQVSQRERTPQLFDRNPSVRFIPFPAGRGRAI